ncbi:MAG: carboxypeptidase-like regulatory domain-containing protein [Treponema sp.]|jgi:hypothetical protein|nr:carboxypeptidase-like regulatory domain-containing protein [Treponema sp.]
MKKRQMNSLAAVLAVLAVLALGGCDNPSGGGSPPPGGNNDPPAAYTVGGTISLSGGTGTVSAVSVALKQGGASKGATNPGAGGVYSFSGVAAGNYTIEASLSGYVTMTIPEFAVSADTDKSFSLTAVDLPPPGDLNGNLWTGNAATLSTAGQAVSITVTWNAAGTSGALGMPQAFKDRIDSSHTVTVIFTKGASDRIRFDRITELRQALTGEGVSPSVIVMQSASGADEVFPVFNGDDLYGDPYENDSYSYNKDRVFYLYNSGDEIFEGYEVRYGSNRNNAHIYVKTGHSLIVDKLRFFKTSDSSKLSTKGFGLELQSGATISFVPSPGISLDLLGDDTVQAITPADLASALGYIGLDYTSYISGSSSSSSTPTAPLFTINAGKLLNDYSSSLTDVNIASSLNALKFLEKHADASKLGNLALSVTSPHLILQKSNPYTGNGYSGVGESDKVSGNLAVWLGSKGVDLQEVYLTNPTLYTSTESISGGVRNVVFDGNNWANININLASGVVVSKNTPVKYLGNGSNSNLWYVVQGGNPSTQVQINAKVLELGYSQPYANLAPSGGPMTLDGLITPTSDRTGLSVNFSATKHYYAGSPHNARPTITWRQYAEVVAAGNTPVFQ